MQCAPRSAPLVSAVCGLSLSLLLSLTATLGCAEDVDGPTPALEPGAVTRVDPPVERGEVDAIGLCRDNVLALDGADFSPLVRDAATNDPWAELPAVRLEHADGVAEHVLDIAMADTAWGSPSRMQFRVPFCRGDAAPDACADPVLPWTEGEGEPADDAFPFGRWTVRVTNPNGDDAALPDGLLVVKPPDLQSLDTGEEPPDTIACSNPDFAIDLLGEHFRAEARVIVTDGAGGTWFSGDDGVAGSGVTFADGTRVGIVVPQDTQMVIGDYTVTVVNPEECDSRLEDGLHVVAPPLERVVPDTVCTNLDATVRLEGGQFRQGATITLTDAAGAGRTVAAADVAFVDETAYELSLAAGAWDVGTYDVTLRFFDGCAVTLPAALEVVPPPAVTAVVPPEVCQGSDTHVTIEGTGFGAGATVTVGPVVDLVPDSVSEDGTRIEVTVPGDGLELGIQLDVTVTNPTGCRDTLSDAVTVVLGPTVAAVDPRTVYNAVNFPIAIFGSGFASAGAVRVVSADGAVDEPLTIVAVDDGGSRIDAVVPLGLAPGTYDVVVVDDKGCEYVFPGSLTVTDQLTVRVCGVDPPFGWTGGDTAVTIRSGGAGAAGCSDGTDEFVSTPRAWLAIDDSLVPIANVAYVTERSLTGRVRGGNPVGGPYAVLVQNPDGGIGMKAAAFTVAELPVPEIEAINPSTVDTNFDGEVVLDGRSFRAGAEAYVLSEDGSERPLTGAAVDGSGESITVPVDVGALGLVPGVYVLRVVNTDEGTWGDFSALAVTNPSNNLLGFDRRAQPSLETARRRLGLVNGRVSLAARFLYAIGGETADGAALDTVERAPLDRFGSLGAWATQRYRLNTPRSGAGVVQRAGFVWVLGGLDAAGQPVASVERALIQLPEEAPEIDDFTFTLEGALERGAWYYRVSATLPADHPTNPGGETLASDVVVVNVVDGASVSLAWEPPAAAADHDVTWNVYRTPTVNGVFGEEALLVSGLPESEPFFVDDGGADMEDGTQRPLVFGATGVWVRDDLPALQIARGGAAAAIAPDPLGDLYLYVAGGEGPGGPLDTVEYAPLSFDGQTIGAFTVAAESVGAARSWPSLSVAEPSTSELVPVDAAWLFLVGGEDAGGAVDDIVEAAITEGGEPGPWETTDPATNKALPGQVSYLRHDSLFVFGGAGVSGPTTFSFSGNLDASAGPPVFVNWNNLGGDASLPQPRAFMGLALETAWLYIVGGTSDGSDAISSVIRQVY